ncbi:cytochrome P450 [Hypoxylon sp. NC0597]|nr:cytochrome P450 [Hypoxylon sp. NC0597]
MATFNISDFYTPAIFTLIALLIYKHVLYPAIFSPLSKIPKAHWSCSISPAWILWARFQSRENRTLHAAHQQHGPIVRVGPNELSINSIEGVKTIYQGGFEKHQWYSLFDNYGVPCMFSSLQSKHHSLRKRWVSHVYSKSYINASPALSAQASTLLNKRLLPVLRASTHASQAPHGVDVHSLFCGAAMDFISAYCFGLPLCADFIQRRAHREHWLALYATRKGHGFFAQELPRLSKALSFLGVGLTPSWVRAANRELEDWCKERSDAAIRVLERERERERRGEEASVRDTADDPVVVRALMAGIEKEFATSGEASLVYDTAIRRRDLSIASEVFDHVLAGQETTGVALTYLSYHLSQSLDLQRELRQELLTLNPNMQFDRNGKVKHPDSRQLDSLPTLHAVVMETVRRYAPAGGPEPRVTPRGSSSRIGPYEVPGGVRVSASAYNIHRDEAAFPDPEKWDHTRWLRHQLPAEADGSDGDEAKNDIDINRYFWGFSSGGRMCLGSNFAMHDMKLIIAAIYSNYTSHIVDDEGIEPTDAYTGHPKSNSLYLRFEKVVGD